MPGFDDLLRVMSRLRDKQDGCPWSNEQTHETLAAYLLEEAYETVDAIERKQPSDLCEELGDVLFQVLFHCQIASENGQFGLIDVAAKLQEKLERRHPHVFGSEVVKTADEQRILWAKYKEAESAEKSAGSGKTSALEGVPEIMPALLRAIKLQQKAAMDGFDWENPPQVIEKIEEELAELKEAIALNEGEARVQHEMGDLLQACTNLSRHLRIDPETALRQANTRFMERFQAMAQNIQLEGLSMKSLSLAELESKWQEAKVRTEKQ